MQNIDLNNSQLEVPYGNKADVLFSNQEFILIRTIQDLIIPNDSFFINGFITATVRQGHATMDIGNDRIKISIGDTILCTPQNIIENTMMSVDFDIIGMIISPKFAEQIAIEAGLEISSLAISATHAVLHLSQEENNIFFQYYDLMAHVCLKKNSSMNNRELHHLLQAAALEMFDKFKIKKTDVLSDYNAADQTFAQFLQMLHNSDLVLHRVDEYADRLHISPKYFSFICKHVTGRTASDIINENIVNHARILLRDHKNSIKMVADKLNFVNQSHFGTFIRRHTGMSPQKLRETL